MSTVCVNFHGPIGHPQTTKLRNVLCNVANDRDPNGNHKSLYLYMSSAGGSLDDGMSLFGLIRSLPGGVTTINTGVIASIAILPFLAGAVRIALPHSLFHFHDFEMNYTAAHNLTRLEFQDHTQVLNAIRDVTFELLKEDTLLTDENLKELQLLSIPTIKDATFAKERGIVEEVKDFPIPKDAIIVNVDY
ncbi:MAG: ATP-dependent Clp protease proteolytic subunit [Terriglobales bacterium]